jgi:hypothetical protein
MAKVKDCGYSRQLESLSGNKGMYGRGLVVDQYQLSFTGANDNAIGYNPDRVWLLLVNESVEDVHFNFGAAAIATAGTIKGKGNLQIDINLPWCGAISLQSTGAVLVNVYEASLAVS